MLFPTSAISNSDGTNCASGRGSSWTRGYHLAAICLSDGSPLTPAVQENRILGVFTVLVQPFHLADGKIRHWSKSPRTPVAKPYLLPRPPDLQQELLSHQMLVPPHLAHFPSCGKWPVCHWLTNSIFTKHLLCVTYSSRCWGYSREQDR